MASMNTLPFAVVLVGVLIAAGTDLWKFRLHNALTIPLLTSGLVYHGVVGGASGLAGAVLGAVVGGLPFLPVYANGGMGAGDIKLLAAVGAWLGPWPVLHVLIVSGLATGIYSAGIRGWVQLKRRRTAGSERQGLAENRQSPGPGDSRAEPCSAATDVTVVLGRVDKRWNAVPFGAMVAVGVVATAMWLG